MIEQTYFCQAKYSSDEKAHEDSSWSTMRQIIPYWTVRSSSSRTKPSEHVQAERGNVISGLNSLFLSLSLSLSFALFLANPLNESP